MSLLTLASFMIFSLSCYTTKKVDVRTVAGGEGKQVVILAVLKTSGEYVEFSKDQPGRIEDNTIVGVVGTETVSIPIAEVKQVWVKRFSAGRSFMAVLGGIGVAYLTLMVIAMLTKESCPFIYSFDGETYVFDAEPYGGAICEGMKRTEWCGLEHLKETDGRYQILITNEVNETQYTDELKLVVVDHPHDVLAVPDISGKMHTLSHPLKPLRAWDGNGRDLMPYVSENDWMFWQSQTEEKSPERIEDLRDELVFEFPKPQGAARVKLLFNGCNTLWASHVVKRYLDLYGKEVQAWYREVNSYGPAYFKMLNMHVREELYSLQIRVETDKGWKSKGLVIGGGPFVSENKVCLLDISDVSGETLRIKVTPPSPFWKINHLAVDYTEDVPVRVREISAEEAFDDRGNNIREILERKDSVYLVMPHIGDRAELIFNAPSPIEGMERSVFLKASGYYDIHLEAQGDPQYELLEKIHSEPGFAVKQAFREYLDWKKANAQFLGINKN